MMQIAMLAQLPNTDVRIHGKSQGYLGLPVRHSVTVDNVTGAPCHKMVTAWKPTPEELQALNAGASVEVEQLHLLGPTPMRVVVGPIPETVELPDGMEMPVIPGLERG